MVVIIHARKHACVPHVVSFFCFLWRKKIIVNLANFGITHLVARIHSVLCKCISFKIIVAVAELLYDILHKNFQMGGCY